MTAERTWNLSACSVRSSSGPFILECTLPRALMFSPRCTHEGNGSNPHWERPAESHASKAACIFATSPYPVREDACEVQDRVRVPCQGVHVLQQLRDLPATGHWERSDCLDTHRRRAAVEAGSAAPGRSPLCNGPPPQPAALASAWRPSTCKFALRSSAPRPSC